MLLFVVFCNFSVHASVRSMVGRYSSFCSFPVCAFAIAVDGRVLIFVLFFWFCAFAIAVDGTVLWFVFLCNFFVRSSVRSMVGRYSSFCSFSVCAFAIAVDGRVLIFVWLFIFFFVFLLGVLLPFCPHTHAVLLLKLTQSRPWRLL